MRLCAHLSNTAIETAVAFGNRILCGKQSVLCIYSQLWKIVLIHQTHSFPRNYAIEIVSKTKIYNNLMEVEEETFICCVCFCFFFLHSLSWQKELRTILLKPISVI